MAKYSVPLDWFAILLFWPFHSMFYAHIYMCSKYKHVVKNDSKCLKRAPNRRHFENIDFFQNLAKRPNFFNWICYQYPIWRRLSHKLYNRYFFAILTHLQGHRESFRNPKWILKITNTMNDIILTRDVRGTGNGVISRPTPGKNPEPWFPPEMCREKIPNPDSRPKVSGNAYFPPDFRDPDPQKFNPSFRVYQKNRKS